MRFVWVYGVRVRLAADSPTFESVPSWMHLRLVAKKETSPSKTYGAPKLGDPPPDPPGHMGASSKNLHFLYTVDKDFNLAPSENLLQAARGLVRHTKHHLT